MAKLSPMERKGFSDIMEEDMLSIHDKMASQIKDFWAKAREEVLKKKGWDALIKEKDDLQQGINKNRNRIHEIEETMRAETLNPEQVMELGGRKHDFGHFKGANFHGIPVECQFDYDIVEFIRHHIDLDVPAKFIHDLGRSALRGLAMSGTFEEARKTYDDFYSLDFREYGVDIPPRLAQVKENLNQLAATRGTLSLPVDKQGDLEAIKNKDEEKKTLDYLG